MPDIGSPCACGGTYSAARRVEATRTVDVVCCFTCGRETPPLYTRSASLFPHVYAPPVRFVPRPLRCVWDDVEFTPAVPTHLYCSDRCKALAYNARKRKQMRSTVAS